MLVGGCGLLLLVFLAHLFVISCRLLVLLAGCLNLLREDSLHDLDDARKSLVAWLLPCFLHHCVKNLIPLALGFRCPLLANILFLLLLVQHLLRALPLLFCHHVTGFDTELLIVRLQLRIVFTLIIILATLDVFVFTIVGQIKLSSSELIKDSLVKELWVLDLFIFGQLLLKLGILRLALHIFIVLGLLVLFLLRFAFAFFLLGKHCPLVDISAAVSVGLPVLLLDTTLLSLFEVALALRVLD